MNELKKQFEDFIEEKCPGAKPLLIVIRGSQAYGTATPTSDTEYAGVYIQTEADIYGTAYKEQINDSKNDTVFYEIKRFLQLTASNNPTILELLNTPEDCIIYKDPIFDLILERKDEFISKVCANSFGGYAIQQIKKARGQDKKQNWEKEKVTRKEVLDFVYVIVGEKSIPWKEWNKPKGYDEKFIGAVNVPNARDVYALYFDDGENKSMGFGYKGLVKVGEGKNESESNQLRLSSIPKDETPICNIIYNKDGYTMHCKDYNSYQEWLTNRNEQRWVDVESHGQKIDGKNMMHCKRLLEMSIEIGRGEGIIVRRPNAQDLLAVRRGEVDLKTLIDESEKMIRDLDAVFAGSNLPDSVDPDLVHRLLVEIRRKFYSK